MLRGGVMEFVAAQDGAVAIQEGDRVFILCNDLLFEVQVGDQVEGPAFLHVKLEMVLKGLPARDMPLFVPGFVGIVPKVFKEPDPVDRLVLEDALHPLFPCHKKSLLPAKFFIHSIAYPPPGR